MKRSRDHPLLVIRTLQGLFIIAAMVMFWYCYAKERHNNKFFYVAKGLNQLFAAIALTFAFIYGLLTVCFVHSTTRRLVFYILIFLEIILAVVLGLSLLYNERFEREYGAFAIDTERDYRAQACSNDFDSNGYKEMGYGSEGACLQDQRSLVWTEYAAGILVRIVILFDVMIIGWYAKSIHDWGTKRRSDRPTRV